MPIINLPGDRPVRSSFGLDDTRVYRSGAIAARDAAEGPGFLATAGAALRQESDIVSFASNKLAGVDIHAPEEGFTGDVAWNEIKGTKYEDHWERFADVQNRKGFAALKSQIDMETEDRRTIAASGGWGILATVGASLLSPTTFIPGGAIVRGARTGATIARTALTTSAAAAGAVAAQEALLHGSQELRTPEESFLAIGAGALFGGVIGGAAGAVFSKAELKVARKALDDARQPGFDADTDVLHREVSDIATGRSVGAAAAPIDTLDDLTIAGKAAGTVAEKTAFMNPMLRTLNSPSRAVRAISAAMMDQPIYLKKNFDGRGETAAETAMLEYTRGGVAKAIEVQRAAFSEARKAGLGMTDQRFREEVGKAMRRGDRHAIPQIEKAAKAWRSTIFEPLKDRAVKAGLLPENVQVSTAESYFSRVYDKPKIVAQEAKFKGVVRSWLDREIDRQLIREKRASEAKVNNLQAEMRDLEMRMLRRQTALEDRIQGGEISPDEFSENEVVEFARRVANGERPEMPETLSKWVRGLRRDGIYDKGGDLAAVYPELKRIPGLLRTSRKGTNNPKGGLPLDEVVLRAWDEGFMEDSATVAHGRGREGRRPSVREFLDALDRDLRGDPVVRVADMDEARTVADFDQVMRAMERSGVDLENVKFATSEAMQNVASAVNRSLDDLDRVKIAKLNDTMSEAGRRGDFEFVSDADRADYLDEVVNNVFDSVSGRAVDGAATTDLPMTARGPLRDRTLNIPDEMIEDFLESDVELIGRRYARLMSADVELTEKFGDIGMAGPLQEVTDEYGLLRKQIEDDAALTPERREKGLAKLQKREEADKRDLLGVRDLIRGNYRPEVQHTNYARVTNAARTFNFMRALGGVTVSSLTDVVRPAMVHGLKAYMSDGLKPLIANRAAFKMSVKEAKLAGAVTERVLHGRLATMAELTDPYSMGTPFERFMENMAVGFTKATGLLHFNDLNKSIASVLTQNRILENAEKAAAKGFDSLPKREQAYMGFMGLGRERIEALAEQFAKHGETVDGVRVANSDAWDDDLRRAYRAAVNKDVDSVIVTKSVGDVPLFANTPTGRTLLQFRSFAMASNQRVLIRGLQEDQTRFLGGVVGMAAIGAMIYALKQIESGREISDNPGVWIAEGLDRSGIFSLGFEVNNTFEKLGGPGLYMGAGAAGQALFPGVDAMQPASRFATRTAVSGLMGPTFDLAERSSRIGAIGFRAMGGDFDVTGGDVGDMRRLTPFASLPYWRWAIDGMAVPAAKEAVE